MSNKNTIPGLIDKARHAAPLGAVVLSALLPSSAGAVLNPEQPAHGASHAPNTVNSHGGHNERLTPDIELALRRETTYLKALNCSAGLLRDKKSEVIGVVTAEHCSLTDEKNERITGTDGNTYIVKPDPVVAYTGAHLTPKNMKKAAVIDKFIVPSKTDINHDIALGVAAGHKPSEVIAAYQKQAMTPEELSELRAGDKIYLGGYPQYKGNSERQIFQLNLMSSGRVSVMGKKNANIDLIWASVSPTNDGAVTSPRDSGGVGFVKFKGRMRSIGVASAYHDLKGDVPYYADSPPNPVPTLKFKGQNKTAVCGFGYTFQTPAEGGRIIRVVDSAEKIPDYISPEQAVANAREDFKNPDVPKTILHGDIYLTSKDGMGKNAGITHNSRLEYSVITQADAEDPDHLKITYIKDSQLSTITIYAPDADTIPAFLTSPGVPEYSPPKEKTPVEEVPTQDSTPSKTQTQIIMRQTSGKGGGPITEDVGHFTDINGLEIGGNDLGTPYYQGGYYNLVVDPNNGNLLIVHNMYNGGKR